MLQSVDAVCIWTPPSKETFFFFFLGFSFVDFSVTSSSMLTVWGAADDVDFFSSASFTFFRGLLTPSSLTLFFAPLFLKPGCQADKHVTLQPVSTLHRSLTGETLSVSSPQTLMLWSQLLAVTRTEGDKRWSARILVWCASHDFRVPRRCWKQWRANIFQ